MTPNPHKKDMEVGLKRRKNKPAQEQPPLISGISPVDLVHQKDSHQHKRINKPKKRTRLLNKKVKSTAFSFFQNPTFLKLGSLFLLFNLAGFFYYCSLATGDLKWIHSHLFQLSFSIISSIFLYVTGFVLIINFSLTRKSKILISMYAFGLLLFLFSIDQGTDLDAHGAYNTFGFLFIFLPSLLITLLVLGCYRKLKKSTFVLMWCIFFTIIAFNSTSRFERGRLLWTTGLHGEKMTNNKLEGGCHIDIPERNWEDLLPNGAFNSWTGSQTCPEIPFFSIIDENNMLHITCEEASYFSFLPDSLSGIEVDFRDSEVSLQNWILSSLNMTQYKAPVPVSSCAVLVRCGDLENLHVHHLQKKLSLHRVSSFSPAEPNLSSSPLLSAIHRDKGKKPLNVLILYFDAVARRHFFRRLPKTIERLEEINKEGTARVFQFLKYHSVGLTTVPNTKAMYLGWPAFDEVPADVLRLKENTSSLPIVAPIWSHYSRSGFLTSVIDNTCQDWSTRYLRHAFDDIDHHLVAPFCLPEYYVPGNHHSNWQGPWAIRRRCLAGRQVHTYMTEYLAKYWESHANISKFSLVAFTEGHEGSSEVVNLLDDEVAALLGGGRGLIYEKRKINTTNGQIDEVLIERERKRGEIEFYGKTPIDLNNTIVVLTSDHGLHAGLYWGLQARSAVIENSLPLLFTIFPKWFLEQNKWIEEALEHNQQALTTHYDFHAALLHLLGKEHLRPQKEKVKSMLTKVPYNRTCEEAVIDQEYCVCH